MDDRRPTHASTTASSRAIRGTLPEWEWLDSASATYRPCRSEWSNDCLVEQHARYRRNELDQHSLDAHVCTDDIEQHRWLGDNHDVEHVGSLNPIDASLAVNTFYASICRDDRTAGRDDKDANGNSHAC